LITTVHILPFHLVHLLCGVPFRLGNEAPHQTNCFVGDVKGPYNGPANKYIQKNSFNVFSTYKF